MANYSLAYRTSDFIACTVPRHGTGHCGSLLVHEAIAFIKTLEETQEANPWVTLVIYGANGLWVLFKGRRLFMALPTRNYLRIVSDCPGDEGARLRSVIRAGENAGLFENTRGQNTYYQWRAFAKGASVLEKFVRDLPVGTTRLVDSQGHPRTFPGEVRERAMMQFERSGRWCPGVASLGRKRHKVNLASGEAVEFDHVLPYSKGGASSYLNIQVLCQKCNRMKRGTAL